MKGTAITSITLLILLTGSRSALGNSIASCDIMSIEASNANTGIDPKLNKYRAIFQKPPFAGFNSFELVGRQSIEVEMPTAKTLTLPNAIGGSLKLRREQKGVFQLTLTIARAGQTPVSIEGIASPGAPLFTAGFKSAKGIWVFGIACTPKKAIVNY
jgi:hypothetical protein